MPKSKLPDILKQENMTFIEWFTREHWTLEKPLLQIYKETGVMRDTLKKHAEKHGLKVRSISEDNKRRYKNMTEEQIKAQTAAANKKVRQEGQPKLKGKPAAWTQDEEKKKIIGAKIAEYKREHNPMHELEYKVKQSMTFAEHLKKNIYPQEQQVIDVLKENNIAFEHQKVVGTYIPDFYLPDYHLLLEVESMERWGSYKQKRAKAKKAFYEGLGYNVIFVEREDIKHNPNIILDILRGGKLL